MSGRLLSTLRRRAFRAPLFLLLAALIAAAFVFHSPDPGRAQSTGTVLLSNTGQTPSLNDDISDYTWIAQQFITGSNSTGYTLSSVSVKNNTSSGTPTVTMSLRADDGSNEPSSTDLATFTAPSSLVHEGVNVFTLSTAYELEANTKYWVRMTGSGTFEIPFFSGSAVDSNTQAGWSFGRSCDSGQCYSLATYQMVLRGSVPNDQPPLTAVTNVGQLWGSTEATRNRRYAMPFRTGPLSTGYELHSIRLRLGGGSDHDPNVSTVAARVIGEHRYAPSEEVFAVDLEVPDSLGQGLRAFTPAEPTVLAPNTTYYFELSASNAGDRPEFAWTSSGDEEDGALPGWSIGNHHRYTSGGDWAREQGESMLIDIRIAQGEVSNLGRAKRGGFNVHQHEGQLSQPFTTGPNAAGYMLNWVTIDSDELVYRRTPLAVTLRPDNGSGRPSDVILGEFYNPLNGRSFRHWEQGEVVMPAVSPIPLKPNTKYHLHLWSDAKVFIELTGQTDGLDADGLPGWSLDKLQRKRDGAWGEMSNSRALRLALFPTVLESGGPPLVTDLRATGSADGSVRLDWTKPGSSAGISRYQYQALELGARNQSIPWHGQEWRDLSGSGPNTVRRTLTGLEPGRHYAFRVRAVDADGQGGDPSNAARDWTEAPLAAPGAGAVGGPGRSTVVTLRWAGPEQLSRGYHPRMTAVTAGHEYRMKEGNGSYGPWIRLLPPQGAEGQISYRGNTRVVEYRAPDHGQGGEREFRNLTPGTDYTFQVRARSGSRVSPASAETTASPRAIDEPVRIKSMTATSRNGRVTFTWTEPPTNNPPHNYSWFWYEPVYDREYESDRFGFSGRLIIRYVIPWSWGETSDYQYMWQPLGGYRTDRVIAVHSDGSVTRSYTTPNIIDTTGYPAGETRNFGLRANFREDISFSNQVTLQVGGKSDAPTRILVKNRNVATGSSYNFNSTYNPYAQPFETGPNPGGYDLVSVTLTPDADLSALPSSLVVTIREVEANGLPSSSVVATLNNPSSFMQGVPVVFLAPAGTVLDPSTDYVVHINGIGLKLVTTADLMGTTEDSGKAEGWELDVLYAFNNDDGQWEVSQADNALQIAIAGTVRGTGSDTVLLSNARQNADGTDNFGSYSWVAQQFTTGSNSAGYTLSSVSVTGSFAVGTPPTLTMSLRADDGSNNPSSTDLATFTAPSPLVNNAVNVFTLSTPYELQANTKYWVYMTVSDRVGDFIVGFAASSTVDSDSQPGWGVERSCDPNGCYTNVLYRMVLRGTVAGATSTGPTTHQSVPVSERDRLGYAHMNIPQFVGPDAGSQVIRHVVPGQSSGTKVGAPVKAVIPKDGGVTYSLKGSDANSFRIDEDSGQIMTGPGETYDRGVKRSYSVRVQADGDEGDSAEAQVTIEVVDTGGAPAPPDIIGVISTSENRIEVGWTEPSGEPTGYQVEWSADGETGWTAVDPPHSGTLPTYAHAGLTPGTTYHYRVRGVNGAGPGLWSEVLAATTTGTRANTPATGAPVIAGAAHVGGTLIADTSGIADADGLDGVSYTYQWIANDGASDADIAGATDYAYTLVEADEGKTISVTVSFTDDAGNEETLTGGPTEAVAARPNSPATGQPAITGDARVSQTLTADISGIADEDGLENATFTYQWRAGRKDIAGATGDAYTLTAAAEGKAVSVTVSFTDDRGHEESLTSAVTEAVAENDDYTMDDIFDAGSFGYLYVPGTHSDSSQPGWDGSLTGIIEEPGDADFFTVYLEKGKTYRFEVTGSGGSPLGNPRLSGVYLYLVEFECSGAYDDPAVLAYAMVAERSETHVVGVRADDDGLGEYTITVAETSETNTGCNTLQPGEAEPVNTPAAGLPTISGTAQVGETLVAYTSGITDEDGLDNASFSYQWQANGSGIAGATSATYTLVDADEGKAVSVTVSFTDDAGNAESLTSAATAAVEAKPNTPATGLPTISGTAQVGETLTADTSGIADADGLANVSYSYQWVANDGSTDADISGATDSTYTLTFAEAEKTISVRVSFTDDRGNAESLTSAATEAVSATSQQQANTPATGAPVISGTAQVGETLTADTSSISDDDGLADAVFSYQWRADGSDIADATHSTYTLADADEGKTISVTVSFTDDAGNEETLTSAATAAVEAKPNTPATGLPAISGTAQVGETLTADVSGIADEDGLTNATFSYQWAADGSDIAGATGSTYTLADADEGKAISVQVSFTDDRGNAESLTSAAMAEVQPKPNSPATGAPTISGTAQVGQTLTADVSGIADEDGLTNVSYTYQWAADGSDIADATDSTYTLVDADEGTAISVRVSFTDDAGNAESLTSAATAAVAGPPPEPLTAVIENAASSHDGENAFTFELHFSEEFSVSYKRLRDHAFEVTGGDVKKAKRLIQGSDIGWRITVRPDGNGVVTIVLPKTTDCGVAGAICTGDGRMLSNRLELTVSGPGS